jgi:RNA recognition motif-containing protein
MRLYVGNISYQASEESLQDWFAQMGVNVDHLALIRDRETRELRGFGFVEIRDPQQAEAAVQLCDGKEFMGRRLVVNEARPSQGTRHEGGGSEGDRPPQQGKRGPKRW